MRLTIPEDAPFTGVQRMWLKGFLDGISSAFPPTTTSPVLEAAPPRGVSVTLAWGSQTGTCETLAKRLGKSLSAKGHSVTIADMAALTAASLAAVANLLVITSTYGDGEPPDNAAALHAELGSTGGPALPDLNYAVLALGDTNYPEFCKCGQDFDARLAALGGRRLAGLAEADVDFDAVFATWSANIESQLASLVPG